MGGHAVSSKTVVAASGLWRTGQLLAVAATVVLVIGLFTLPGAALNVLWNITIPLLPATFLISPAIWRNVCPLATLNTLANGLAGRRALTGNVIQAAGLVGIVLLGILMPARRFLFNANGTALAVLIIAVALAALLLGTAYDLKAGFCNAVCPVLPVERLYSQRPLVTLSNPRCVPCTMCTTRGCIDLAPAKSIAQTLGRARRSHAWLTTGYGAFAAAFPGFVVGYYSIQDEPLAAAGSVYITIVAWAGGSYLLTQLVVRAWRVSAAMATLVLAAAAGGLYYWFAAPLIASALGISGVGTVAIRAAALTLVAFWLWRAVPRSNGKAVERPLPIR